MANICLVTPDIVGPIKNGGIGTAFYFQAVELARQNHQVTILYSPPKSGYEGQIKKWQSFYSSLHIDLELLDQGTISLQGLPRSLRSYQVYLWLNKKNFDYVHFADLHGLGFFAQQAKKTLNQFPSTQLIVQAHSSTSWHRQGSFESLKSLDDIELDYLERQSVAMADLLISPSQYMLDWLASDNWKLPKNKIVIPHAPLPNSAISNRTNEAFPESPITEIVFAGRLETRKGIELFFEAIDLITEKLDSNITISLVGKIGAIDGMPANQWLKQRKAKFKYRILADMDHLNFCEFLATSSKLIVIPSLVENSSCLIWECLSMRKPFIASRVGGNVELIHPNDFANCLFDLVPQDLANKILAQLHTPYAARFNPEIDNKRNAWGEIHENSIYKQSNSTFDKIDFSNPPFRITVCMPHKNRPEFLRQALESLAAQSYTHFEVLVVDDASEADLKLKAVENIKNICKVNPKLKITFLESGGMGASRVRNWSAQFVNSEFLLFMDDDNLALPNELADMTLAASRTGADVVTCVFDRIDSAGTLSGQRWVPSGNCAALAIHSNTLGDTNFLIRTALFKKAGGFSPDIEYGEDWDLLLRLSLDGYHIELVPEPLFQYRDHTSNRSRVSSFSKRNSWLHLRKGVMDRVPFALAPIFSIQETFVTNREDENPSTPASLKTIYNATDGIGLIARGICHNVNLRNCNNGILVECSGEDPNLIIPTKLPPASEYIFSFELISWQNSELQLYYKDNSSDFQEKNSVKKSIVSGNNIINLRIRGYEIAGSIRFDFPENETTYYLKSFEVLSVYRNFDSSNARKGINSSLAFSFFGKPLALEDVVVVDVDRADVFQDGAWSLHSLSMDPQLLFYKLPWASSHFRIFAEILVDQASEFQVFYAAADEEFSEKNSRKQVLISGINKILIEIQLDYTVCKLRIDPSFKIGDILLTTLEIAEGGFDNSSASNLDLY